MPAIKKAKKETIVDKTLKAVGLKKDPPPSPGTLAAKNREKGNEIIGVLRSVDFARGAYKGAEGRDSVDSLQKKTLAMITALETNPTITDDISKMNDLVLYAARAFKNAIADGSEQKALWAKNALCAGILYYRDNVPEDHEEDRAKILAARAKYMETYKMIIQLYEKADAAQRRILDLDRQITSLHKEYDPRVEAIRDMRKTQEGQQIIGRIKLHENEPSVLSDKENEFLQTVRNAASNAHTIFQLMANRVASQLDYETSMEQAADVRIQLSHKPDVFNEKLTAEHALLLEEQAKLVARSFAEAASLIENTRISDAKLKSVLNGKDAQVIAHHAVETMETILYDNNVEGDIDALKEGRRMAQHAAQAQAELKAAQAALEMEMQKAVQFEENENLQQMFNLNEETVAEENTNSDENVLFNYNT